MNNKVNLLIDTIPYSPDIFNNVPSLYHSDTANSPNILTTYQTIFIFSLNSQNALSSELNKYNNPYFMLYGLIQPTIDYNLPPVSYFSATSSTIDYTMDSNLIKTIYKSYVFTPEILDLLKNIGYNVSPTHLFPPSQYPVSNASPLYDNNILFQKLTIYDTVTGRNDEIIFIFFYQDYITDNPIHLNNSYINNTSQTPFQTSVYHNKQNWNVFIYPYIDELEQYQPTNPIPYYSIINNNNTTTTNYVESLNFNNKDYCPYIDKLEYKYFENYDFVKYDNKLNTSMMHSKNLISFGDYYVKNDENKETIFISLNEITKNNDTNNYIDSISETNTIKFLAKSKSYSNINTVYSMSNDNKLSYINKKYNSNDLTYAPYFYTDSRIKSMYPICKNFFVNTYVNINAINTNSTSSQSINDYLQSTNWYIRKLLIQINPLIIYDPNTVILNIYPLINCKNNLNINPMNNIQVIYSSDITGFASTYNYYIDHFRLVVSWSETIENETVNFVYYIIVNIAYYSGINMIISDTSKTTNVNDLGYINFTYIDYSNTLIPNIFKSLTNIEMFNNLVDFNLIDTKYYSLSLNYNSLSTNITQDNLIFINHFSYLIPYVKPVINYIYSNQDIPISLPISNIYNVLEKKVNNFIMNTILLNDNFISVKFNNYNAESIFKLSITFDSNIINDYYNCDPQTTECQNIDYIDYLQYINTNFGGITTPYIQPNNLDGGIFGQYTYNSIMIPTGNYLVFKYHNNFITRNNSGGIDNMNNDTVSSIFFNNGSPNFGSISLYNFALLIKLDDDFNPDDTFFVNNKDLYITDFLKIYKYLCNQGNYQTKMYLVPCNTDYSLYYYTITNESQYTVNFLVGIELFNVYNGVTTNDNNNDYVGNKIFMNMVLNEYMNFYELNFIVDVYDEMKENNNLSFDKNNLLFKRHKNIHLNQIVKYDSLRFNSNVPVGITYWDDKIINQLEINKILINYMKVLDNNLFFILNCNKIINLLKKCIIYLNQIKTIIYFENFNLDHGHHVHCHNTIKWKNYTISKDEYINILNYLATCCVNINKVNQIINITFCYEDTTVDNILTNLVYLNNTITIQTINDYIFKLENSMIFYANRIKLVQDQIFNLFKEFENYNTLFNIIVEYITYKQQYIQIIKEIYVNNIILYAINQDVFKIFNNIIIKQIPTLPPISTPSLILNSELNDYIINSLTEIIDIFDIYKLNLNILKETLNFVRLFYDDHSVYCIYPILNDNIIKTNYIYNTTYYNDTIDGNNLPNINIFTYFPPNPLPIPPANPPDIPITLTNTVINNIRNLIIMISDTYKYPVQSCHDAPFYNIYTKPDFITFIATLDDLISNSNLLFNQLDTDNLPNIYMQTYIYSWDIIQKFISYCLEIKLFIKCMFYLNKIKKHINKNYLLHFYTDANNYIDSIEYLYSNIQKINSDPAFVITQYQVISDLLLKEVSVSNTTIFTPSINCVFTSYNQYAIIIIFLKGFYNLKETLLNELKFTIFDNVFKYLYLGYQGEDIIPFNDYNLLIDQRSLVYSIIPTNNNIYLPTANMHTFNSNQYVIELLQIFNNNKKNINDYFLSLDNSQNQYLQMFNALNYGYIHTDYIFVNVDNVNN
jgi:hypothetical protein